MSYIIYKHLLFKLYIDFNFFFFYLAVDVKIYAQNSWYKNA